MTCESPFVVFRMIKRLYSPVAASCSASIPKPRYNLSFNLVITVSAINPSGPIKAKATHTRFVPLSHHEPCLPPHQPCRVPRVYALIHAAPHPDARLQSPIHWRPLRCEISRCRARGSEPSAWRRCGSRVRPRRSGRDGAVFGIVLSGSVSEPEDGVRVRYEGCLLMMICALCNRCLILYGSLRWFVGLTAKVVSLLVVCLFRDTGIVTFVGASSKICDEF